MLRSTLLCALIALCACGPLDGSDDKASAAQQPAATSPTTAASEATDPDDPVAGLWWVFAPKFPIRAFRLSLEAGQDGSPRGGTWVTFDWRGTAEAETLQRRSKPVRIEARSDGTRLIVEGPAPMLTESGQPNGQNGHWRLDLRRSDLPGEPPRWSGTAVHDGALTDPEGVSVDMERGFRRWQ